MLSIVLKILSILGILLLCLLGLAILLIFLVLFFPVSYKLTGKKDTGQMTVSARALWLSGVLRVSFDYPEPGRVLVKVLFYTIFDSGKEADHQPDRTSGGARESAEKGAEAKDEHRKEEDRNANRMPEESGQDSVTGTDQKQTDTEDKAEKPENSQTDDKEQGNTFFEKTGNIKYTIQSIYDKIKNIWENISYYIELLQEEETKQLFSHVIFRLGKILRSVRPRHIRGQILFGTGAPDTTGYAYGVYGMMSPFLGDRLLVTPDFTRAVLEGDLCISGHITVFIILWNGLKVLLDRKLRRFIKKMKAGRKK